jgi:tetratricopeptide (TPR) repeat protein
MQLERAIRANDVEKTKALLAAGANPSGDPTGRDPVLTAVDNNNFEIVRILAKAGANLNYTDGPALLLSAVEQNKVEMVKLLLSLGANVNGTGMGESPLHSALSMNRPELVKVLIAAGADTKAEMAKAERYKDANVMRSLQEALGISPAPIPPQQIVDAMEKQWQWVDTTGFPGGDITMAPRQVDVEKTLQELGEQLKTAPQDRNTLLLWARLQLAESFAWNGDRRPASPTAEAALDRVLAAHPHDPEALYYKARLYAFPIQTSWHEARRRDVDKAVEYLRQAVKYAPGETRYRTTLAFFLADQGHPGEAKAMLQAAHQDVAMLPLLEDLASLPIPANAEFVARDEVSMMLMLDMGSDNISADNGLRERTYSLRQDRSEIEKFYQQRWPDFHWIPDWGIAPHKPGDNTPPLVYRQFLRGGTGAWEPSRDLEEIMQEKKKTSGIMMVFVDLRTWPEVEKELDPQESGRMLVILNYRR